ncbi:MAG: RBBP9/YdeN family alpha/beta hydrolase [Hyphomicrobiaceae bacterium]
MKTADAELLMCIEGRTIDHKHWLWRWSQKLKTGKLVDIQKQSNVGTFSAYPNPILAAVKECRRPIILIGYHLGVAAIVRSAQALPATSVKGAFLVAPADFDIRAGPGADGELSDAPLPFPSLLVASRTDPRCSFEKASDMALAWGSHLVDAGDAGQIDASSGHGPWPEGLLRLGWFLKRL